MGPRRVDVGGGTLLSFFSQMLRIKYPLLAGDLGYHATEVGPPECVHPGGER